VGASFLVLLSNTAPILDGPGGGDKFPLDPATPRATEGACAQKKENFKVTDESVGLARIQRRDRFHCSLTGEEEGNFPSGTSRGIDKAEGV